MKNFRIILPISILAIICAITMSQVLDVKASAKAEITFDDSSLQWHNMRDLPALQKENPKPVLVDVYTDWCKWCKVMDDQSFSDPALIKYLNQHFYMVKFNAEDPNPIAFNDKSYNFLKNGRRGYHELAYELCQGKLSYPSLVVLDKQSKFQSLSRGFKSADGIKSFLSPIVQ